MSWYYGVGEFCNFEDVPHLKKFVQHLKQKLLSIEPVKSVRSSLVNTFKVDSLFTTVLELVCNEVAKLFLLTADRIEVLLCCVFE